MPSLQLFSRQGCHLCELLLEQLLPLVRGTFNVEEQTVKTDTSTNAADEQKEEL